MLYIREDIQHISQQQLQAALAQLPDWRREQALRFKHSLGQTECAFSYLLLCEGLQRDFGITSQPHFLIGEHGKPTLQEYPDIHFNISHCKAGIAVAIDHRPIGVDIECVGRGNDSLARHVLNDEEYMRVQHASDPGVEFTKLWTRKEALVKLTGLGITDDLRQLLTLPIYNNVEFTTRVNAEKGYALSLAQYREHEQM